jgi:hypothetical protein
VTREVFVVKDPIHAKTTGLLCDPDNLAHTLYVQFLPALIWRREQDFDPNLRSNWWARSTEDEDPVQRNIVGESPFCSFCAINPVEDDGKSEVVSNSGSSLHTAPSEEEKMHTWA